jgi:hypothetical protein
MNNRNKAILTAVLVGMAAPTAASAECPPVQKDGVTVEVEISFGQQDGITEIPVLSGGLAGVNFAPAEPAVKVNTDRDPANSLVVQQALAYEGDVISYAGGDSLETLADYRAQVGGHISDTLATARAS